jgi:hypothetical protein
LVDVSSNKKGNFYFWGENIVNILQGAFQDRNLRIKTIDACKILFCVRKLIVLEMCVNENYI